MREELQKDEMNKVEKKEREREPQWISPTINSSGIDRRTLAATLDYSQPIIITILSIRVEENNAKIYVKGRFIFLCNTIVD